MELPVVVRQFPQPTTVGSAHQQLLYRSGYIIFTGTLAGEPAKPGFKTFRTTGELNTVRKIVAHHLTGSRSKLAEAVAATIEENEFNRKIGTNPEKHLRVNTPIRMANRYLGHQKFSIEVLADEAAPTPSAGYAKWAHIPRPQRKALTVLEGYEPMTLTVPVLFDAVRENGFQEDVEDQIQWLEWMGGRGIKFVKSTEDGVGKPPLVEVYSAKGSERETPLVPKPFQTPNIKWFVDDLTFDEHPLRKSGGARIRQAVVVKLVEYVVDRL
jgi:hypothetical protein